MVEHLWGCLSHGMLTLPAQIEISSTSRVFQQNLPRNFSAYYIQINALYILHFYICLVALYKIICLQFFICIFLTIPPSVLYCVTNINAFGMIQRARTPTAGVANSGVTSPKIWGRSKKLGWPKCLIFGEKHYFVWKNASQSTKSLYFPKMWGGHASFCPPLSTPMVANLLHTICQFFQTSVACQCAILSAIC